MTFVREWWSYFVLVSLAGLLEAFVGEAYKRVRDRVDERLPDDLDLGAGQWLEERIEAGKLPIRLLVDPNATDDAIDAYIPNAKTIVLSAQCFDKRDPSYWAVAAHELGHALVHGKAWILSFFFASARVLSRALFQVGMLVTFCNLLYASAPLARIGYQLFGSSLAAYAVVLVDEVLASAVALKLLAADARVDRRGMIGAITRLGAAFMTYLGRFVGQLILVSQWDSVTRIAARHAVVPTTKTGEHVFVFSAVLSVLLVALFVVTLLRTATRGRFRTLEAAKSSETRDLLVGLGRSLVALLLVAVVWDLPLGPWFPFVCVGGIVASQPLISLLVRIATFVMALAIRLALLVLTPVFIILRIVWLVLYMVYRTWSPADSDPVNPGPLSLKLPGEYAHLAAPHGVFEVARGQHGLAGNPSDQRAYAGLQLELVNDPPLETRIAELALPALHLLFVAALWTFLLSAR